MIQKRPYDADSDEPRRAGRPSRGYDLLEEEVLQGPPLPGIVTVAVNADRLIDALAADLVVHAERCMRQFGDFHLALSGGSTPQPLYERLMYDPNYRMLPWRRTHLWMVDERAVPMEHDQSNFREVRETIVDHADIPLEQVHPIIAMSETADADYEAQLKETLAWREPGEDRLDFVLLGMGADGHTAGIFPFSDAASEDQRLVIAHETPAAVPPRRITMTYPLINAARVVAVMVTGEHKRDMLARIATGEDTLEQLPIKGVIPAAGELRWYLDAAAAGAQVEGSP